MHLLGRRNWYLPRRLGWLPRFEIEAEPALEAPGPARPVVAEREAA
jgi:hypothetical protein